MTRYLGDSTAWKQLDKNSGANIDWLLAQGVTFSDVDDYHGFSHVACAHEFEGGGAQAMATLEQAARDNGVEILTETPVKELVIADDGTVCGVAAASPAPTPQPRSRWCRQRERIDRHRARLATEASRALLVF